MAQVQQFVEEFNAHGQLPAKIIRVEIPHWNPPNVDTYRTIVGFQAMPDDAVVGQVLVGLHVQHGGNAELLA